VSRRITTDRTQGRPGRQSQPHVPRRLTQAAAGGPTAAPVSGSAERRINFYRAASAGNDPVKRQNRKGFTLIEILIVVIILGILAAIVIPQFTNASKEAKQSAVVTMVQSTRSQIALFKLQHNDMLPGAATLVDTGGTFDEATFWNQLTLFTDLAGGTATAKDSTHVYGPYMQSKPSNSLVAAANASVVVDGTAAPSGGGAAFVYDYAGGGGSGKFWAIDSGGAIIDQ
jgi:general secretion pathway protein G